MRCFRIDRYRLTGAGHRFEFQHDLPEYVYIFFGALNWFSRFSQFDWHAHNLDTNFMFFILPGEKERPYVDELLSGNIVITRSTESLNRRVSQSSYRPMKNGTMAQEASFSERQSFLGRN